MYRTLLIKSQEKEKKNVLKNNEIINLQQWNNNDKLITNRTK